MQTVKITLTCMRVPYLCIHVEFAYIWICIHITWIWIYITRICIHQHCNLAVLNLLVQRGEEGYRAFIDPHFLCHKFQCTQFIGQSSNLSCLFTGDTHTHLGYLIFIISQQSFSIMRFSVSITASLHTIIYIPILDMLIYRHHRATGDSQWLPPSIPYTDKHNESRQLVRKRF